MSDTSRPIFVPPEGAPKVAQAIVAVMREIEQVPKSGTNTEQKYRYVEATVLTARVQDAMARANLVLSAREISRGVIGGILFMRFEFDAYCEEQAVINIGSFSGACRFQFRSGSYDDRAPAKVLTSAWKCFEIGLFKIPADVGDIDRDRDDFEPPRRPPSDERYAAAVREDRRDPPPDPPPPETDEPPGEPLDVDARKFRFALRNALTRAEADKLWNNNLGLLRACADPIYSLLVTDYHDRWEAAPPNVPTGGDHGQ